MKVHLWVVINGKTFVGQLIGVASENDLTFYTLKFPSGEVEVYENVYITEEEAKNSDDYKATQQLFSIAFCIEDWQAIYDACVYYSDQLEQEYWADLAKHINAELNA